MTYLWARALALVRSAFSFRGVLLIFAGASGLGVFFVDSPADVLLFAAAAATIATLILLITNRERESRARMTRLENQVEDALALVTKAGNGARLGRIEHETRTRSRLERARRQIDQVRGTLAVSRGSHRAIGAAPRQAPIETDAHPLVTVVVPCYNEEPYIASALESVQRQSFEDWECVVVDDASTDGSVARVWRFVSSDPRFRLIRHKVNSGLSASRNTGLRAARARFVVFLDGDDMLMADSLLDRIEALGVTPPHHVAGSFCGVRIVAEDTTIDDLPSREKWNPPSFIDFVTADGECPFNAHAPLLRTDVVRLHAGFDESIRHGAEDWDLWLRILRSGYIFVPSTYRTAVYRQKFSSMAKDFATAHVAEAKRLIATSYLQPANIDPELVASYPFPEPLSYYRHLLVFARRAIQFAAMSLLRGDEEAVERILANLTPGSWDLVRRHIDLEAISTAAFRRVLGLEPREMKELEERLASVTRKLLSMLEDLLQPRELTVDTTAASSFRPSYDILFCPQNAHQATALLPLALEMADTRSVAFLMMDRVSGNQGTESIVRKSNLPTFSIDEWVLGGFTHRAMVVASPRDGALEELMDRTHRQGGKVLEVVLEGSDVMRLHDTHTHPAPAMQLGPQDLANQLDPMPGNLCLVDRLEAGPLLWFGLTDPDPDNCYTVEEYPETLTTAVRLEEFRDQHKGERCVIIGNGPSLNLLDLTKLKGEVTFGVNGLFYAEDRMGWDPTYYVVEDNAFMRDNIARIVEYRAGHKFFPSIYRKMVGDLPNVSYFMMNRGYYAPESSSYCVPRFSTDAAQRIYSGQSVTIINLQIAYYMGFTEVILIGMDFSYTIPQDAKVEGVLITSASDDPNHFHPDYFGKGRVWKNPQLDRVLASYQLAKLMYESDGRRIVNGTAGGQLELFERIPYDELFE